MAYFNDTNNADFYSSVYGGFYSYPLPSQTFPIDTDGANGQIFADPADQWNMARWSGPMFGSQTGLHDQATTSFGESHSDCFIDWYLIHEPSESVAPSASYTSGTDGYSWPSYDWSADHQQAQFHYPDYLSRDDSFVSTAASEMSTTTHTLGSGEYSLEELGGNPSQTVPLEYWGASQSRASVSTSYLVGVQF